MKRSSTDSSFDDDLMSVKRPRLLDINRIRSAVLDNAFEGKRPTLSPTFQADRTRAFRAPRLTKQDYYTVPALDDLRSCFNDRGECFVRQLTVARRHYGSITFHNLTANLAGVHLDSLVQIERCQVVVHPNGDDARAIFTGQAIVSLIGVYPIDRSISDSGEEITNPGRLTAMNYGDYLSRMTKKFHGHFIAYAVSTGTWTFQIEYP